MIINPQDHNYFYLYSHNMLLKRFEEALSILNEHKKNFKYFNNDEIVKFDFPKANQDSGLYGLIVVPTNNNYKNISFLIKTMGHLKPLKEDMPRIEIVREYFNKKTPSKNPKITFLDEWDLISCLNEENTILFEKTSPLIYRHDKSISLDNILENKGHILTNNIEYIPNHFIKFYDLPKR